MAGTKAGHVLIAGAGVAGPVVAFWLAKAGFKVTAVEKASQLYKSGQGIDLEGAAREIVEKMGVMQDIRDSTTGEQGFAVDNDDSEPVASIGGGFTSDIEIMRGDMCEIFTKAAQSQGNVIFKYGCQIEKLHSSDRGANVKFSDGSSGDFTAVIGADGMRSKTRELALKEHDKQDCFKGRDHYIAYYSIPRESTDDALSHWYNATGGRSVLIRPGRPGRSSAYLNIVAENEKLQKALGQDKESQKQAMAEVFEDVGGLAPRAVKGMMESTDFYFEQIAQVKLTTWHEGCVALVGDAAYAPSPITGEGTNLAVVGAFIIAGELSDSPDDPRAAFTRYGERLRDYVEKAQVIPLGGIAPRLANPRSKTGVWLFRSVFKVLAESKVWKLFDPGQPEPFQLPVYSKLA